jgi:hypothetical protein
VPDFQTSAHDKYGLHSRPNQIRRTTHTKVVPQDTLVSSYPVLEPIVDETPRPPPAPSPSYKDRFRDRYLSDPQGPADLSRDILQGQWAGIKRMVAFAGSSQPSSNKKLVQFGDSLGLSDLVPGPSLLTGLH